MKSVEFMAGTHIDDAAKQLVAAFAEHGPVKAKFNGIELTAGPGDTPEAIVVRYDLDQAAAGEAYRASAEGKRAAREADQRRADQQAIHDSLMRQLPSLNMQDDAAVLDWLCEMQGPSDHTGVIVRRQTIVSAFEKAGYVAGANCGSDYRDGDRANMFRYLVGQALSGLKEGPSIHPIINKFADEWREQFGVQRRAS